MGCEVMLFFNLRGNCSPVILKVTGKPTHLVTIFCKASLTCLNTVGDENDFSKGRTTNFYRFGAFTALTLALQT